MAACGAFRVEPVSVGPLAVRQRVQIKCVMILVRLLIQAVAKKGVYRARILGHKFGVGFAYAIATWAVSDGLPLHPFYASLAAEITAKANRSLTLN